MSRTKIERLLRDVYIFMLTHMYIKIHNHFQKTVKQVFGQLDV